MIKLIDETVIDAKTLRSVGRKIETIFTSFLPGAYKVKLDPNQLSC